ncbi:MAG: biopolymer transporter ExbD [Roseovarius sp.]|uniref:ExbD/TolR family protein n=1 Tax=Roseovarius sp. TaxID=1486281 RepID=UPI001B4AF446|nr:biopolymer transporter ExbD [Roseovarius sp.]MBQ0749905.1 biopolymer transporter ExbD [Roseovarius sp.]MBQ0811764.1 biopolymer transporter ExbD [Roseovarius sp.]
MARAGFQRRKLSLTSLIDVIFLLLLFFMLSSTFAQFSEVDLATAGQGQAVSEARPIFLQLRADELRLNARAVPLDGLAAAIAPLAKGDSRVLVSTAAGVTAQRLTDLLVALRGIPHLSVQVLVPS